MEEPTGKPGEGTAPLQAKPGEATAASKVEFSPEQQAKLDALLKEERRKLEKEYAPLKDKASQFEKFEQERKQKEDAEKSELERLKTQVTELSTRDERVKILEGKFKDLLDKMIAQIPEEKKSLVPTTYPVEDQLEWIETNKQFLFGSPSPTVGPSGSNVGTGKDDPLKMRAKQMVDNIPGLTDKEREILVEKNYLTLKREEPLTR